MNSEQSMLPERDERLGEILAAWIEAAERGQAPDSAEWLARHAEFATELEEFLANRARLQEVAEPLCQAVRVTAIAPSRGDTRKIASPSGRRRQSVSDSGARRRAVRLRLAIRPFGRFGWSRPLCGSQPLQRR